MELEWARGYDETGQILLDWDAGRHFLGAQDFCFFRGTFPVFLSSFYKKE
jgi:hypothetical protein